MNIFYYKTGELIVNSKKYQLTKMQSKILFVLINNKLNTYEEIYSYIYNLDAEEVERLDRQITRAINTHICRLRKTGLKIQTTYNYGMRLLDKICIHSKGESNE